QSVDMEGQVGLGAGHMLSYGEIDIKFVAILYLVARGRAALLTLIIGLMNGTLASAVAQTCFEVVGKKESIKLSAAITVSLFKSQKLQKLTQGYVEQSFNQALTVPYNWLAFIQLIMVAATFKNDSEV
ncbi:10503_t:CDS:2, partial [Acaulospora colombiana]